MFVLLFYLGLQKFWFNTVLKDFILLTKYSIKKIPNFKLRQFYLNSYSFVLEKLLCCVCTYVLKYPNCNYREEKRLLIQCFICFKLLKLLVINNYVAFVFICNKYIHVCIFVYRLIKGLQSKIIFETKFLHRLQFNSYGLF